MGPIFNLFEVFYMEALCICLMGNLVFKPQNLNGNYNKLKIVRNKGYDSKENNCFLKTLQRCMLNAFLEGEKDAWLLYSIPFTMPLRIHLLYFFYLGNIVIIVTEEMLESFLIRVIQTQFEITIKLFGMDQ